ncbi:MAG: sugar ABC transporter permease [Chloroflexi bacterium]|nr:sugar ABC transporter permease [Chloroflexota bacterium]
MAARTGYLRKSTSRRRWRPMRVREAIDGYMFIALSALIIGVFVLFAAGYAFYLSFTNYSGFQPPQFVGLRNYVNVFRDTIALQSFRNTLIFVMVTVPLNVLLSLAVAMLLNREFVGMRLIRSIYFIPVVVSAVVTVTIFKVLYEFPDGVFNELLKAAGLEPIAWYRDKHYALISIMIMSLWKSTSFNSIIFLAALQDTPRDLIDAAKVDGADGWQRFLNVIVPHLRPVITFVVVLGTIGGFRVFTEPYVLTQGGPENATRTIALYTYNNAFQYRMFGYAGALSFVLLAIILLISLIQLRLSRAD